MVTALLLAVAGCGITRMKPSQPKARVESLHLSTNEVAGSVSVAMLQARVMRFADSYAITIAQATDDLAAQIGTPEARLSALRWKLNQSTSAFIDASGPSPALNALDMLVFVTLSRMVAEDHLAKLHGDAALPLLEAHRRFEAEAWSVTSGAIRPPQQQELRDLIVEWRQKNPDQRYVGAVRFREFVTALGRSTQPGASRSSIFSLLYLDPFSGLDPTAAAIEETRLLGERAMYYSQRLPMLLSWQAELLAYQLGAQPESKQLLSNAERLTASAESFAKLAEQLPRLINDQRQAAIQQFLQGVSVERSNVLASLASEEAKARALLVETRQTLESGSEMAKAVDAAVKSLDAFVRAASTPNSNRPPSAERKPFDVLDYGRAASEISAAARDLNSLVAALNQSVPQATQLSQRAVQDAESLVDRAFWRGVMLIVILLVGSLLAALTYRRLTSRDQSAPLPSK
jgi:hypothetical protein